MIDRNGENLRQVTVTPLTSSLGPQDWTRDGRQLILSREVEGHLDLLLLDLTSGREKRLTTDPADEYGAAVSPDGSRIAFHAETDGVSHIVVIKADGSHRRTLTEGPGLRYAPRWSPDGKWLLFTAQAPGGEHYDLHAIRVADRELRVLVATPADEREGDWWPR